MSKIVVCEICDTRVHQDQYGLAPAGWYSLSKRGGVGYFDFCSPACLEKYAATERTQQMQRETEMTHA
jgi:hypothetical protein